MCQHPRIEKQQNKNASSPNSSLKQKGLAQARGSHTQASSFRLSKSLKGGTMVSCDFSLRRVLLIWARLHLTQNEDSSLKRQLE